MDHILNELHDVGHAETHDDVHRPDAEINLDPNVNADVGSLSIDGTEVISNTRVFTASTLTASSLSTTGEVNAGSYKVSGTEVINSSRDILNVADITASNDIVATNDITATGTLKTNLFDCRLGNSITVDAHLALGSQNISSVNDITSSGTIYAPLYHAENIDANGTEITFGDDIALGTNHILSVGNITSSGNITAEHFYSTDTTINFNDHVITNGSDLTIGGTLKADTMTGNVNAYITVDDDVICNHDVSVAKKLYIGDGTDHGTMIDINAHANQLSADTANTGIAEWLKVYDQGGAQDLYIPMFSAANANLISSIGYDVSFATNDITSVGDITSHGIIECSSLRTNTLVPETGTDITLDGNVIVSQTYELQTKELWFSNSSNASDEKHYQFLCDTNELRFRTVNDLKTVADNIMIFNRSGNSVSSIDVNANINLTGDIECHAVHLGDGTDNGPLIQFHDATGNQIATDTANTDVNSWVKVYDEHTSTNGYIPIFSGPQKVINNSVAYVPCTSWIFGHCTSGNHVSGEYISFDSTTQSADAAISYASADDEFSVSVSGYYTVDCNVSVDAGVSDIATMTRIQLHENELYYGNLQSFGQLADTNSSQIDYSNMTITGMCYMTTGKTYKIYFYETGDAETRYASIRIMRIS